MSETLVRTEVVEGLIREFLSIAEIYGANLVETRQAAFAVNVSCANAVREAVEGWAEGVAREGEGE